LNNEIKEQVSGSDGTLRSAESTPTQAKEPATLHKIFIGEDGLRAGWSLLIFVALVMAIGRGANFILYRLHAPFLKPGLEISPMMGFVAEGLNLFVVLFLTWIMSRIERRPFSVYGYADKRKLSRFFAGFGWGITCLSLLVFTLWKSGFLVFDGRRVFGGDVLRYGAVWLVGFLLVGLAEESFSRGYAQFTLTRGLAGFYRWAFKTRYSVPLAFWTSAMVFSILFGLGHSDNPGESPIGLLQAGLVGMVFCLSLWRTGSLWWAIGFHTSWDWAQSFVYGVPDSGLLIQHHLFAAHAVGKPILSGGSTGPEGSIFAVGVMILISLIILFTLPLVRYEEPVGVLDASVPRV
jgi:uncharacterized protein